MVRACTRVVDRPGPPHVARGLFIIIIGEHLIWRFIRRSPNRQIKALAKISRYTVYLILRLTFLHLCAVYNISVQQMCISNLPGFDMVNEMLLEHVAPPLHVVQKGLLKWPGIHAEPHVKHSRSLNGAS